MSSVSTHSSEHYPVEERASIKALYVVNKHAKQLAKADRNTQSGWNSSPKRDSLRKEALYRVKHNVLDNLQEETTCTELHEIRGDEFYCFYFGQWSFHLPVEECDFHVDVMGRATLQDFNPTSTVTRVNMSLEEALQVINHQQGINANNYFERRHVPTQTGDFIDIGWSKISEN